MKGFFYSFGNVEFVRNLNVWLAEKFYDTAYIGSDFGVYPTFVNEVGM